MFDTLPNLLQRAFLAAYVETGRIGEAAAAARMNRGNHYDWLAKDAAYAEAFKLAEKMAGDRAEDEAKRRGIEGVEEFYIHRGEIVCDADRKPIMRRKYSDKLLAMILQGAKPDKYARKVEHSGEVTLNLAERLAAGRARALKPRGNE